MRRQNEVGGMTPALAPNVKNVYRGTAVSRRRAMTIVGAVAGLPLLGADDLSRGGPLLHQWTGTSLGSPSQLLLYHHDRVAAARIAGECAAEIERLERIFALYEPTARSLGLTVTVASSFVSRICSRYSRDARPCLRSAGARLT